MDDFRFGTAIPVVRQRRGWRQTDLAERSGVSQTVISRMERGHLGPQSVDDIRAVAAALDIRVDHVPRWRAGDLDRLLNRGHSALHESVARMFRDALPAWILAPEVSSAIYGERGVIDILAWHPGRRVLAGSAAPSSPRSRTRRSAAHPVRMRRRHQVPTVSDIPLSNGLEAGHACRCVDSDGIGGWPRSQRSIPITERNTGRRNGRSPGRDLGLSQPLEDLRQERLRALVLRVLEEMLG